MKTYKQLPIPEDSAWERTTLFGKLHWRIRNFLTSCHNLIKWFPTIWNDRDWDGHYILKILQKKIEFQRKELVSANRHTRIETDNRDMTIVLNLIERVREEYYGVEYLDYRETKFRFEDVEDKPDIKSLHLDILREDDDKYLSKYPLIVRKVLKDKPDIDKSTLCFWVASYNHERANDLLFKILRERMAWWWD